MNLICTIKKFILLVLAVVLEKIAYSKIKNNRMFFNFSFEIDL